MDTILEVNNLSKQFYKNKKLFTAVNGISFTLQRGECLGIVGESGCGKSTTVKMLTHLLKPDGGDIFLNETDIQKLRGKSLKEFYTEIQMVFQVPQDSFDPRKKIGDSIMESMRNHGIGKKKHRIVWNNCCSRWSFQQRSQTATQIRSVAVSVRGRQLPVLWQ